MREGTSLKTMAQRLLRLVLLLPLWVLLAKMRVTHMRGFEDCRPKMRDSAETFGTGPSVPSQFQVPCGLVLTMLRR